MLHETSTELIVAPFPHVSTKPCKQGEKASDADRHRLAFKAHGNWKVPLDSQPTMVPERIGTSQVAKDNG